MSDHTPADWTCGRDSEGDWQIHRRGSEEGAIAVVRTEAAARLIAAAPELLAACHAVIADGFLDRPSLNKCRAAITKAEGRS